jgi:hypothetical protein
MVSDPFACNRNDPVAREPGCQSPLIPECLQTTSTEHALEFGKGRDMAEPGRL